VECITPQPEGGLFGVKLTGNADVAEVSPNGPNSPQRKLRGITRDRHATHLGRSGCERG
jgi:hypothetical protein